MAIITSQFGFNQDQFNISTIFSSRNDVSFWDSVEFGGKIFDHVFAINYGDGLSYFALAGFDLEIDYTDEKLISGTITDILQTFDPSGLDLWDLTGIRIEEISISAIKIYASLLSSEPSDDRLILSSALSGDDTFNLSSQSDFACGNQGSDTLLGWGGKDNLYGGDGADTLDGGSESDKLYGGRDNDRLIGGAGNDVLDGGFGYDIVSLNYPNTIDVGTGVDVSLIAGTWTDQVGGVTYTDKLIRIEGVGGSEENDTIEGNSSDNWLNGNAGNDAVSGISGDDYLQGQAGDDTLDGGDGDDTLLGGDGNDFLKGGYGVDEMNGGLGNDTYIVDNATDKTTERANEGTDAVLSSVSFTLGPNVENLTLTGTTALTGVGNAQSNWLNGNKGNNSLSAGDGSDTLIGGNGNDSLLGGIGRDNLTGGAGTDTLTGGADADTFAFTVLIGVDHVTDFVSGTDQIALAKSAMTSLKNLTSDAFWTGTAAHDASDRVIYNAKTGALSYDADGNGSRAAVQIAVLDGHPALAYGDVLVF